MAPKGTSETPEDVLRLVGEVLLEVSASKRPSFERFLRYVLGTAGLNLDEHRYLMSDRFKHKLPNGEASLKRNQVRVAYSLFTLDQDTERDEPYFSSFTTIPELCEFTGKTATMIRNYMNDPRYRTRDRAGKTAWRRRGEAIAAGMVMFRMIDTTRLEEMGDVIANRVPPREGVKHEPKKPRGY